MKKIVYASICEKDKVYKKLTGKNLTALARVKFAGRNHKEQTQSYLEMHDIVIPVVLRKNDQNALEFAMQYEYIPAVNKVFLELPEYPLTDMKKSDYTQEEIEKCLEDGLKTNGLNMVKFRYLSPDVAVTKENIPCQPIAVSQSITDQQAIFTEVALENRSSENSTKFLWFPITSISDFLANNTENTSLQSQYALDIFYKKYRNALLQKPATKFHYDEDIVGKPTGNWKKKQTIMEHQYRFGVVLSENDGEEDNRILTDGQVAEYALSNNSVGCLLLKKIQGKVYAGLSKQQRSPFIERDGISEYYYEIAAGMIEEGEDTQVAVQREIEEETGIRIKEERLILVEHGLISKAAEEYIDLFMCEVDEEDFQGEQKLDEQENIEEIEWFDLQKININQLHAPLTTKHLLLKAKEYYSPVKIRKQEDNREDYE